MWPGEVVVDDPLAREVRGHRQLRALREPEPAWPAEHHTRIETVASTYSGGRAVVELLAHLDVDGQEIAWPVAVVAEAPDDLSVVFRSDCSQWPVAGRREVRAAILEPGQVHPGDIVGRDQAALEAGDAEAVVSILRGGRVLPRAHRPARHPPRHRRAPLVLHRRFGPDGGIWACSTAR